MLHLGDVCKIDGTKIPKVDVITFGAPCQDLSVAGKRKGMQHEAMGDEETTRSGLFFEAVRIIREMREDDRRNGVPVEFCRPRFCIYENVPGAYSSNFGKDWQAVLTELVKVIEPEAPDVPLPDRGGWSKSGCIADEMGRWSIAWRLLDAQHWGCTQEVDGRMLNRGTPQRRKRVALVADFAGRCAPEVLFERKGLHWYPQSSSQAGEGSARSVEEGSDESGEPI